MQFAETAQMKETLPYNLTYVIKICHQQIFIQENP